MKTANAYLLLMLMLIGAACTPVTNEANPTGLPPSTDLPPTELPPTELPTESVSAELPMLLQNTVWHLQALIVGGDAEAPLPPGSEIIYLTLTHDHMMGNSGCNTFTGRAVGDGDETNEGTLIFSSPERSQKHCGDPFDAYEAGVLEALANTARYNVSADLLILLSADERPLALLTRFEDADNEPAESGEPTLIQHPGWQVEMGDHPLQTEFGCEPIYAYDDYMSFPTDCTDALAEFGCNYLDAHNIGWGDPSLVVVDCVIQVFEDMNAWTDDRYLYSRGIDHFAPTRLIAIDDGQVLMLENHAALQAYLGEIDSAKKALSAALLHTRLIPISFETMPYEFSYDVPERDLKARMTLCDSQTRRRSAGSQNERKLRDFSSVV